MKEPSPNELAAAVSAARTAGWDAESITFAGWIVALRAALAQREAELEQEKVEHTRAILRYTVRGYTAGENADSKAWRERAEHAEASVSQLKKLLEEEIEGQGGTSARCNYCWWCGHDIDGADGPKEPHAKNCWLVRVRALLAGETPQPQETKDASTRAAE